MLKSINGIQQIQNIHLQAFGDTEGPVISNLAKDFLSLPDTISITVERDGHKIGNIIFTPLKLNEHPSKKCFLLAPLGVLPPFQKQAVGKELIEKGVAHLKSIGGEAIFVLGEPSYYPKRGFVPTSILPPHHELVTRMDAWKMLEIIPNSMAEVTGTAVAVAVAPMMDPTFWDTSGR